MAETFDLVFKGGTLVNHAGEGLADIGVRHGRIAAIGDIAEGHANLGELGHQVGPAPHGQIPFRVGYFTSLD